MTTPPQGSDERGEPGGPADPLYGRPYGEPPRPEPGSEYGRPQQPYGPPGYGPAPHGQPPYGQAPYGQPAYGPPPQGRPYGPQPYSSQPYGPQPQPYGPAGYPPPDHGQPPRRSRGPLVAAITGVVVLLAVGGVVLAFALRSEVLDPGAVERDVAAQFEQREGVAIELQCADGMRVDTGATYECTGTTADDEDVRLEITVTDEERAAYTWTEP
jgi:hypothetical protein